MELDTTQFSTVSRPSASSVEAWLFRKIFKSGSVVPNAIVTADVDGDGVNEMLMGSTEGVFAVLKEGRRTSLLTLATPGTISAVFYHEDTIYIVSMEGILTVLPNTAAAIAALEQTKPKTQTITIPANVTTAAVSHDYLVFGASDRKVHLVHKVTHAHVRSFFIGSQVFSVAPFVVGYGKELKPFIFAAGTSHLTVIDPKSADPKDPALGTCAWSERVDRNAFPNTKVTLDNPALPVYAGALYTKQGSFVAAATEDGFCYLFLVKFDDTTGEIQVSRVWQSDPNLSDSRLPGIVLEGGIQRVYLTASKYDERKRCILLTLSNGGVLTAVDDSRAVARSRLIPGASAFALLDLLAGDTLSVAALTTEEISIFRVPCGSLGSEGCFASGSDARSQSAPELDTAALVEAGRLMFPQLADASDTFVAQRAMRVLMFGYSASEWAILKEVRSRNGSQLHT